MRVQGSFTKEYLGVEIEVCYRMSLAGDDCDEISVYADQGQKKDIWEFLGSKLQDQIYADCYDDSRSVEIE